MSCDVYRAEKERERAQGGGERRKLLPGAKHMKCLLTRWDVFGLVRVSSGGFC